jgi:TonB-linked SusC/RagA family outer membrane protein
MKRKLLLFICAFFVGISLYAQERNVTGKVSDAGTGEPLPGVNVVLKGTTIGTTTDVDGGFSLVVPDESTVLVFSFIGYLTEEIVAGDRSVINVALVPDIRSLEEFVVIGYGQQRRANLTGSVESIDGDILSRKPVLQTSMALQGMAPGVIVTQGSGQPGEDGGTIRIRGISTLGNNDPLVLIDGVEGSLDAVNPRDIENISVLKDAAAASIYGSRAASGVILITTKRGKDGDFRVNYNSYAGWQSFTELPEFTDGLTYLRKHSEARENVGMAPVYSDEFISLYEANYLSDPYTYPNSDWQELLLTESGFQQNHNLTFSGGTEKLSSMASFTVMDQKGQMPNFNFNNYSFRVNNDLNVNDYMSFRLDVNAGSSNREQPRTAGDPSSGIFRLMNRDSPLNAPFTPSGRYASNELGGSNNLANLYERGFDNINRNNFRGTVGLTLKPVSALDLKLIYTPNYSSIRRSIFEKPYDLYHPTTDEFAYSVPDFSDLNQQSNESWEHTVQALATYQNSFGNHNVNILGGFESYEYTMNFLSGYRRDFTFIDYPQLDAGSIATGVANRGYANEWALLSYFSRVNYNYKGKYLVEANLRYDGSSRFAKEERWGLFPSFSAGWRVAEESFMESFDFLSNLMIRASWGQLGNQFVPGGFYPYISNVSISNQGYVIGGNPVNGAGITTLANSNLTWETTETTNIGVDFGLFNNKFSGSFEYYVRNTSDILLMLNVPGIIGLNAPYQNAGKVKNEGWDMRLIYDDSFGDLRIRMGFLISDVKNEVVDLVGTGPYISAGTVIMEGQPINAIFGYQSQGLFQSQAEIDAHVAQFGDLAPGDIRYVDQNNDGVINADDRVVLGNSIPRYNYSFDFSAQFRGFDAYLLLSGVGKRDVYLTGDAVWAFYNGGKIQQWHLDHWTEANPNASYPRLTFGSSHNNFNVSDFWVYNASFLRIKTFQLGYTIPASILQNFFLSNVRIYATADNLFTFHGMPEGWDPERPNGAATWYPITRTIAFGLDINF